MPKSRNHHIRVYDGKRVDIKKYACADCDINTHDIGENYTVRDQLWLATVGLRDMFKILCIGCFERRLGRRLTPRDFKKVPANYAPGVLRTSRFQDRLGIWKAPRAAGRRASRGRTSKVTKGDTNSHGHP